MAAADGLPAEWADVPADPPRGDADDVVATETQGVIHLRVRARVPRASGSGSLAPTRAWVSAPPEAWESAEPSPATRD